MDSEVSNQQARATQLIEKWKPVLNHPDLPPITDLKGRPDLYRLGTVAQLLENTVEAQVNEKQATKSFGLLQELAPTNATGSSIDNYDPVLISMIRRAMPNLVAYDICGVQPMTGPTGLVFAFRPRYSTQGGTNAFYTEANTAFSAGTSGASANATVGGANINLGTTPSGNAELYNFAAGMSTTQAEALGSSGNVNFAEMAFSIEKVTVTAKSRALKAEYSVELAQDLKAIHGLDAETELTNILTAEILADINREIIRTIYVTAKPGAEENTAVAGTFDLDQDANGRWLVEKQKGLMFQLEREANKIAKETRRGKGNVVICSSDVASALQMAGQLDIAPMLMQQNQLQVDDTGNTFAGVLNGRFRVFIDPYATSNFLVVGYRGASPFDAGLFYCPYVPLQLMRAADPNSFQPKIGFKTRYGVIANPFAEGVTEGLGALTQNSNVFYRRVLVSNLL
jgi:hypothetical protein